MSALIPLRLLLALHIVTGLTVDALCAQYEILVVTPAINNEAILPGSPLPPVCHPATTMKVLACRSEYEPASFVVKTDGTLRRVRVDVDPLTGPSGSLEAGALDVRVVQLLFRRVTDWPALAPALLLHDADLIVVDEKPQPQVRIQPPHSRANRTVAARFKHQTRWLRCTALSPNSRNQKIGYSATAR